MGKWVGRAKPLAHTTFVVFGLGSGFVSDIRRRLLLITCELNFARFLRLALLFRLAVVLVVSGSGKTNKKSEKNGETSVGNALDFAWWKCLGMHYCSYNRTLTAKQMHNSCNDCWM